MSLDDYMEMVDTSDAMEEQGDRTESRICRRATADRESRV